ncbi:MAG: HAMP domain-containing sensor histidine kinase [Caldilineaceae bacterium]
MSITSALFLNRFRRPSVYVLYLLSISLLGGFLLLWGIWQVQQVGHWLDFLLLLMLALMTALVPSTVKVGESSITYAVYPIVSFAAIPTLGIGAAIVIKVFVTLATWLIKPKDAKTWKKSLAQLGFNMGMHAIAMLAAALVLSMLQALFGVTSLVGQTLPWFPAAIVYDQVNLWLLIAILVLQQGNAIQPRLIWQEEWWATQLFVATYAIGGAILAFAIQRYDRLGMMIFFLPILLSAYAFRLYVQRMQAHMDNLEGIVAARTNELVQANRQKDTFLAVLSHDMMTPLASIRYSASLIQRDPATHGENRRLAELILRSQGTLFHMMRNILDIEKVIAGIPFATNKQPCDWAEMLLDISEVMQVQALEAQIALHTEIENNLPVSVVDRQQIERVVNNLLSNALKYTEAGGAVWLRVYCSDGQINLTVEDTGYGIPPEDLTTIFDHFKRAPQHRDKAIGSGLGLAITKALVAEHQGVIRVQSEVGKGTVFTVQLPVIPPSTFSGENEKYDSK